MSKIIGILERSSDLVKGWGAAEFSEGRSLSQALSIQGISLWEVMSVDFARLRLAENLANDSVSLRERLWPYLCRAKDAIRNCFKALPKTKPCRQWPQKPGFLFLGFEGYIYRDTLKPIAQALEKDPHVHVIRLNDGGKELDAFESIWDHWTPDTQMILDSLQAEWNKNLATALSPEKFRKLIEKQGSVSWERVEHLFQRLLHVDIPRFLPRMAIAKHILSKHKPALVISPDVADPRSRAYCLLARQMGIPSLEIEFGMCGFDAIEWKFFVADRVAVCSQQSRQSMRKYGIADEKIAVTGSSCHDYLWNVSSAEVHKTRAELGIPEGKKMVLVASVYHLKQYENASSPEALELAKKAIVQAMDQFPDVFFVVKPHPNEDQAKVQQLVQNRKNVRIIDQRKDIRELTKACDAYVAFAASTATFGALILNKIIICPIFPGWTWSDLFAQSGAVLVGRSLEEIVDCYQLVANDSGARTLKELEAARKIFLNQWVREVDGAATLRIEIEARRLAGLETVEINTGKASWTLA